ncbi:MAG TPA: DMT family transporter, partial [Thermoguttaceae bacterium]|nr:DMT family transporter [Thermoguttaceae bacterium]
VVLLREPVVRRDLIPLCFGVVGVGIILVFELGIHTQDRLGVVCGLASGVFFACVVMFMRHLRHENAAWLVAISHIGVILAMLPWAAATGIWPTPLQLVVLAAFGSLQMAIPYVFLIRGLRTISSQEAVGLGLLEPVLMPFWVFALGLETPRWWTIAGGSLILVGLALRYVVLKWVMRGPAVDLL